MKSLEVKKLFYSINEVSRITELEKYVLRFWETEFEQLQPQKNKSGNRTYTNGDIKLILEIKKLLREQRYTIEGAKKILSGWKKEENEGDNNVYIDEENRTFDTLRLRNDLLQIKQFLEGLLVKLS
ncbi:MAG: MerR family transcriptional regulator [Ignavibacteriales bacterium]|nr:MerR family transcriptional regulator [Ignavibacteriales bacterium]